MNKILITYFEPFNNNESNASKETVLKLDLKRISNEINYEIETLEIPVSWNRSFAILQNKIKEYKYILLCGEAPRQYMTIEYDAINLKHASIPDNDGIIIKNTKISNNECYIGTINAITISELLNNEIKISLSAGSYLCNYLFYKTLEYIEKNKENIKATFIHVPANKQSNEHALLLEKVIKQII